MNDPMLRDLVYCLHPNAGSPEYAKGVAHGLVGTLMATGMTFTESLAVLRNHVSGDLVMDMVRDALPRAWVTDWDKLIVRTPGGQKLYDEAVNDGLPMEMVSGFQTFFEKSRGGYSCFAPSLLGCVSAGQTLDSCRAHMTEAIELHLKGLREEGETVLNDEGSFLF